jgi:hypothetical protein
MFERPADPKIDFSTTVVVELRRPAVSSKKGVTLRRIEFCEVVHRRDYAVSCWSTGCVQAGAAAASRLTADLTAREVYQQGPRREFRASVSVRKTGQLAKQSPSVPAPSILEGATCLSVMVWFPILTVREGPSVRYRFCTGTCVRARAQECRSADEFAGIRRCPEPNGESRHGVAAAKEPGHPRPELALPARR